MSSGLIESYKNGDQIAAYLWDKYEPHYIVFAGKKAFESPSIIPSYYETTFRKMYATKEQAKRSYQYLVEKIKKGEQIKGPIETNPLPF